MKLVPIHALSVAVLAGICAVPLAASAQPPSYATGEKIHGTIASLQDGNHLLVNDDRGFTDSITLRPGAADGVDLEPGQRVTIDGSAAGSTFLAARIEAVPAAPRAGYAPAVAAAPGYYPAPVYYPAAVYYPAPVYYRPAYSIGLFFHFH